MELKERVIVVTGAGQGLGKKFALDCASEGARLALADLNLENVENCLLYTSPSPRDATLSRMPSSA